MHAINKKQVLTLTRRPPHARARACSALLSLPPLPLTASRRRPAPAPPLLAPRRPGSAHGGRPRPERSAAGLRRWPAPCPLTGAAYWACVHRRICHGFFEMSSARGSWDHLVHIQSLWVHLPVCETLELCQVQIWCYPRGKWWPLSYFCRLCPYFVMNFSSFNLLVHDIIIQLLN